LPGAGTAFIVADDRSGFEAVYSGDPMATGL
jgi:hypothetical protein